MALPLHELAALGTATCWAMSGLIATDAVRSLGAFHFNLIRQIFVSLMLVLVVLMLGTWHSPDLHSVLVLAVSGVIGILIGDTFNYAAIQRIGPRRTGAVYALNAPMAAVLSWLLLGETLGLQAIAGIALTACGVATAIMGRPRSDAHRFEALQGTLITGLLLGLGAALGQAIGALIARPVMTSGIDPYFGSLLRVGASGLAMGVIATTRFAPAAPKTITPKNMVMTLATAVVGLLIGMTLFLYALQGSKTGIIATLSATSPVIILPMIWLRTKQRPSGLSWLGAALAVVGLALIFTR